MRRCRGVPLLQLILALAVLGGSCATTPDPQDAGPSSSAPPPTTGAGPGEGSADGEGTPASEVEPATPEPRIDVDPVGPLDPGTQRFSVEPARWTSCGEGNECATVTVPLDHDEPEGDTVDLAVVRVPASDPARRRGSLFVNPGGPGASGVATVTSGFRFDDDTMARYDLVGFDPRGIGASDALGCSPELTARARPDPEPDDPAEVAALEELARSVARRCEETDGERLDHLDTYDVARDLDLLRQAVGDQELTYYGLSYGTLIGLRYLELFPQAAGRIVLDGVVDPSATLADLLRQQAGAFDRAFADMAAACDAVPDCPPGGLAAAYDQAQATVDAEPVGGVGPGELATAAIMSTYNPGIWPIFRQALGNAVTSGDFAAVEQLSDRYVTSSAFAAFAAVTCTDSPVPDGAAGWDGLVAELAAVSPRFGPMTGNELRTCAYWPVRQHEAPRAVRADGAGPILVIGTTGDAATPIENAVAVAEQLADGHLLVHDGQGHTAHGDECVEAAVHTYLVDGRVPAPGSRC